MRQVECLLILLLSIVFVASYVDAGGGGHGGHGDSSHTGSSSYHGGYSGGKGGYDGGKYSGYSYPSEGHKGYGVKSSGYAAPSSGSKGYGAKYQQANKRGKDSTGETHIIDYGHGTPSEECQKFLNEMSVPRREFAGKRSAYFEARENPNTNPADIENQQKEIRELFHAIEERNVQNCRWVY